MKSNSARIEAVAAAALLVVASACGCDESASKAQVPKPQPKAVTTTLPTNAEDFGRALLKLDDSRAASVDEAVALFQRAFGARAKSADTQRAFRELAAFHRVVVDKMWAALSREEEESATAHLGCLARGEGDCAMYGTSRMLDLLSKSPKRFFEVSRIDEGYGAIVVDTKGLISHVGPLLSDSTIQYYGLTDDVSSTVGSAYDEGLFYGKPGQILQSLIRLGNYARTNRGGVFEENVVGQIEAIVGDFLRLPVLTAGREYKGVIEADHRKLFEAFLAQDPPLRCDGVVRAFYEKAATRDFRVPVEEFPQAPIECAPPSKGAP